MLERQNWRILVTAIFVATAGIAQTGVAQETSDSGGSAAAEPPPMSLIVSGGVSLGTYEAGYLYYLSEFLKRNPELMTPRIATGASAGSINAFVSLLNFCSEQVDDPTESLFWRVWLPISIQDMLVEEDATPISALSRSAWDGPIDELRIAWERGLPVDCDMVLGVTVTRLNSMDITTAEEFLTFSRTEEKFAVRVQGQGLGQRPTASSYVDPDSGFIMPMLAIDGPDANPFQEIATLLIASAAFPVAFSPVPVRYCLTGRDGRAACPPGDAETRLFLDGGVFDNTPLRFATEVAASGLDRQGDESLWRAEPSYNVSDIPDDMLFLFVQPEVHAIPPMPRDEVVDDPDGLVDLIGRFAGSFINTARNKELVDLFRANPELADQVIVGRGYYWPVSALLGAFLGFFERGFRVHDFYLGMADARRNLVEEVGARLGQDVLARIHWVEPDPVDGGISESWQPFACFRQVVEGAYQGLDVCSGDEMADYRAALQMTVDRLYDYCHRLAATTATAKAPLHDECTAAIAGDEPPTVPGIERSVDAWRMRPNEAEMTYALRLLATYGFVFRDLGLGPDEGDLAEARIAEILGQMLRYLGNAQSSGGMVIETVGRYAANSVYYSPVEGELHILLGEAWEIGGSGLIPVGRWRGFRWTVAMQLSGLYSLLSTRGTVFGMAPLAGFEFEPVRLSSALLQLRFGLRAGYLFSTEDGFLTRECPDSASSSRFPCSRFVSQFYVALSLIELVRVHLSVVVMPALRAHESTEVDVHPQGGVQFNFGN